MTVCAVVWTPQLKAPAVLFFTEQPWRKKKDMVDSQSSLKKNKEKRLHLVRGSSDHRVPVNSPSYPEMTKVLLAITRNSMEGYHGVSGDC